MSGYCSGCGWQACICAEIAEKDGRAEKLVAHLSAQSNGVRATARSLAYYYIDEEGLCASEIEGGISLSFVRGPERLRLDITVNGS